MAVVAITGGGAGALAWLLGVPGASNTVLEAVAPYSTASLADLLGRHPDQSVSADTARSMAEAAYRRALSLRKDAVPVAGIACTASIATSRPRRGGHRCHAASWSSGGVRTYSLRLSKGSRDRAGEDAVVSALVIRAMAEAFLVDSAPWRDTDAAEHVESDSEVYGDPVQALLAGHPSYATVHPDGASEADGAAPPALLPGSFNPLHEGHVEMARAAAHILKSDVAYELSVTNVDKPPLEEREVRARLSQFENLAPIVVSRAPLFHEKARLFPGSVFVIGADTAERLVQPRYYRGGTAGMLTALEDIRRMGCRFLVSGRADGGEFRTLGDVRLPEGFTDMFAPIPESKFRSEASSTEIRLAGREL